MLMYIDGGHKVNEEKKPYETPIMDIICVDQDDVICTSGNSGAGGGGIELPPIWFEDDNAF